MSKLYLGTSGWSYENWRGDFYPRGTGKSDMLDFYVTHFDSVEINATFYRLPFENMVKGWNNRVPEHFRYSVKGSRQITHYNKLSDVEEYLGRFLDRIAGLGPHLGSVFWQLPPSFKKDRVRLEQFLELLPTDLRFAVEFRDTSWLDDDIYRLLEEHNIAPVWVSSGKMPDDCTVTADFIYIRFHGLEGGYTYAYSKRDLEPWAKLIARHLDEGKDAHLYFNNTGGNAPESARMMREMLSGVVESS